MLAAIWGSMYAMWGAGLQYMGLMPWLDFLFYPTLFSVFLFLVFLLMIVASMALHTNGLYRAAEAELLLYMPIAPSRAALYRSAELSIATIIGAVFLITPLIAAAINVQRPDGAPPLLAMRGAPMLPWLLPSFLIIPTALGAMGIVALRRFVGSVSTKAVLLGALVVGVITFGPIVAGIDLDAFRGEVPPGRLVRLVQDATAITHLSVLPSHWLVAGFFGPARGNPGSAAWYGGILTVAAAVCLVGWVATLRAWYYPSWLAANISDTGEGESAVHVNRLRQFDSWLPVLPRRLRAFVLKDGLLFARDGMLRTQGLLMMGPLLAYFLLLRTIHSSLGADPWYGLLIGGTNVAALGLVMCTIGSRFLLPLVGIERQKFWLLRMAPPRLWMVLVEKWVFGSLVLLAISQPFLLLSNEMSYADPVFMATSHAGLLYLAPTIAAICVGVGALFPETTSGSGKTAHNGIASATALLLCFVALGLLIGGVGDAYSRFLFRGDFDIENPGKWEWITDPRFLRLVRRNFGFASMVSAGAGFVLLVAGHWRLRRLEIP